MHLAITFDYEIYGDGSGDVFTHMIYPTERILSICAANDIQATIYFEVVEYLKMKQQWDSGNKMGYFNNPIEAIERQLKKAALAGHDIQLHIHPQWVEAVYRDRWIVDLGHWRLGDFVGKFNYTLEDLLREGKEAIESIIRQVVPDYTCIALRAGGYNVMPSGKVYEAMINTGLKVDSSVYPGGFEQGVLSCYDYRRAALNKDFWWVAPDDFTRQVPGSGVMEIPVFALAQSRLNKFSIQRLKSALLNRNSALKAVKNKTGKLSATERIRYFLDKEAFTWDFCLFSTRLHRKFFRYIRQHLRHERGYFVLIGHPKNFTSDESFRNFIQIAKKQGAAFMTLKSFYDRFTGTGLPPSP